MSRFIDAGAPQGEVTINPGQVIFSKNVLPQMISGLGYLYLGANSSGLYKKSNRKPSAEEAGRGCAALSGMDRFRSGIVCYNYWSSQGSSPGGKPYAWKVKPGGIYKNPADPKLAEDLFKFQWVENTLTQDGINKCGSKTPPSDIYNRNNTGPGAKCPGADGILGTDAMCKIVQQIVNNPDSFWGKHWMKSLNVGSANLNHYRRAAKCTFNCSQIADDRKAAVGCPTVKEGGHFGDGVEVIATGEVGAGTRVTPGPRPRPPTPCKAGEKRINGKCTPQRRIVPQPLTEEDDSTMLYVIAGAAVLGAAYYYVKKKKK
jgi:LPXTG-motif cell wall-anchored protein|tara:strand:- start:711 stop:1658 length:948 start_codon:yes stop_codon:yes gene_type:complete